MNTLKLPLFTYHLKKFMKYIFLYPSLILLIVSSIACSSRNNTDQGRTINENFEVQKTDEEWKKELTTEQYNVLRKHQTEKAFSGKYDKHYEEGVYLCAGCGNEVFSSETKFDSRTGWPSFYAPVSEENIGKEIDNNYGMRRTEVHCGKCGGHLGHVFEDGPQPTGLRYCLNSAALQFTAEAH